MLKLITSNEFKLKEFRRLSSLDFEIEKGVDLAEVDADAIAVAVYKSKSAGSNTIIEDTILIVSDEPVVDIRYKLEEISEVGGSAPAVWKTTLAVNTGELIQLFEGTVQGKLVSGEIPDDAFGFDANFIPDGQDLTLYELEKNGRKDEFSARKLALESLESKKYIHEIKVTSIPDWDGNYQGDSDEVKRARYKSNLLNEIKNYVSEEWLDVFNKLDKQQVPDAFPYHHPMNRIENMRIPRQFDPKNIEEYMRESKNAFIVRDLTLAEGMFGIISKAGAEYLVNLFKGARFIDPIAGSGWFAKALREAGAEVVAGDAYADTNNSITEVIQVDGETLVEEHGSDCDVMLLSWAPYDDDIDYRCALKWGSDKPILVYGEFGQCCNSSKFESIFVKREYLNDFPDLSYKPLINTSMIMGKTK